MMSQVSKVFLKNTIRHTEYHNKMVEEDEMWRCHSKDKQRRRREREDRRHDYPNRRDRHRNDGRVRSSCIKIPRAHMDRADTDPHSYVGREDVLEGKKSSFWLQTMQEVEEKDPNRWGHSGFKEQNPDLFQNAGSDSYSDEEEVQKSHISGKSRDRHKRDKKSSKKEKKRKKKKIKKRSSESPQPRNRSHYSDGEDTYENNYYNSSRKLDKRPEGSSYKIRTHNPIKSRSDYSDKRDSVKIRKSENSHSSRRNRSSQPDIAFDNNSVRNKRKIDKGNHRVKKSTLSRHRRKRRSESSKSSSESSSSSDSSESLSSSSSSSDSSSSSEEDVPFKRKKKY